MGTDTPKQPRQFVVAFLWLYELIGTYANLSALTETAKKQQVLFLSQN